MLVDDDFGSIVQAIRLGRRVLDNVRRAVAYLVAIHVPIAGVALIPVLMGWPLILFPVHVVFLELIIDPACSLVFEAEPEEPDVMARPPRDPKQPIFPLWLLAGRLAQGVGMLIATLSVFAVAVGTGLSDAEARAITFTCLVIGNLTWILLSGPIVRGRTSHQGGFPLIGWTVVSGALTVLILILTVPALRAVFSFGSPPPGDLLIAALTGSARRLHGRDRPIHGEPPESTGLTRAKSGGDDRTRAAAPDR